MKMWLLLCSLVVSVGGAQFDFIIRNGHIMDGTGNPWFQGDLAVKGDRIVEIGRIEGDGKRVIDANGLVVAPGFIDMHSHSDWTLLEDGHAQSKIRQGVTTEVLGEGQSVGPYQGQLLPRKVMVGGKDVRWTTLNGYFDTLERAGCSVNIATYVG